MKNLRNLLLTILISSCGAKTVIIPSVTLCVEEEENLGTCVNSSTGEVKHHIDDWKEVSGEMLMLDVDDWEKLKIFLQEQCLLAEECTWEEK